MFLLRTEAGLSATETGQVLGQSGATVRDLSRLVARGERGGDLVASASHVLDVRSSGREPPLPRWMPRALPGLRRCRIAAGLSQDELARRARVARETLSKIEHGRPARQETVRRLAAGLSVPPGVLTGAVTETRCEPGPQVAEPETTRMLPSVPGVEPVPVMDHPDNAGLAGQPARAVRDCGPPQVSRHLAGLREWRTFAGLTQDQLARRAGVARETLIRNENQQRGARSGTIRRLADALLVAPSMLTGLLGSGCFHQRASADVRGLWCAATRSSIPADHGHAVCVRSLPYVSESTQEGAVLLYPGDPCGRASTESAVQAAPQAESRF